MKARRVQVIICLCMLCMLLWGRQVGSAQSLDEVITKHLDAIGGADRWRQMNSMKIISRISRGGNVDMEMDLPKFSSVKSEMETTVLHNVGFRADHHIKVSLLYVMPVKMKITRAAFVDAGKGWITGSGTNTEEEIYETYEDLPMSFYATDRARMNLRPIFLDYAQEGHSFTLKEEKQKVKEQVCYVIEGWLNDGNLVVAYIDVEEYYLVKKYRSLSYVEALKEGKEGGEKKRKISNTYHYEDFREVNGYVLPFKETQEEQQEVEEGGDLEYVTSVLKHKEIIINPSVDKAIFQPPAKEKPAEEKEE